MYADICLMDEAAEASGIQFCQCTVLSLFSNGHEKSLRGFGNMPNTANGSGFLKFRFGMPLPFVEMALVGHLMACQTGTQVLHRLGRSLHEHVLGG